MLACRNRGSAADGPKIQSGLQHRGSLNQNQGTFGKNTHISVLFSCGFVCVPAVPAGRRDGSNTTNKALRCEGLALHLHDGHAVGAKTRALVQLSNWGML